MSSQNHTEQSKLLQLIREQLSQTLPETGEAYLFGSRARGNARRDSDWDVLIVLDKQQLEDSDFTHISYPLTLMGMDYGQEINPILYTKEKWHQNAITPFYRNVMTEGIRL